MTPTITRVPLNRYAEGCADQAARSLDGQLALIGRVFFYLSQFAVFFLQKVFEGFDIRFKFADTMLQTGFALF